MNKLSYFLPVAVLILIIIGFLSPIRSVFLFLSVLIGISKILIDGYKNFKSGRFSLDYIAFLAMTISLITSEYIAGSIIALMLTGGEALEKYAEDKAESSLKTLANRIPSKVSVIGEHGKVEEKNVKKVLEGEEILVRTNEIVPLDGKLITKIAVLDESHITGESLPVTVANGAYIKSGSINNGPLFSIRVVGGYENSYYMKIVSLVKDAKFHQAPLVNLAAKINAPFTIITLILAGIAFFISGDISRALAVLVIATPCPLIIAAPVAFIAGMSKAAKKNIIIKTPAVLENLTRVKNIFFDKTGTLTVGIPRLVKIEIIDQKYTEDDILKIAASIETHSLHPLAKSIVEASRKKNLDLYECEEVDETLGKGISGKINNDFFEIKSQKESEQSGIALCIKNTDGNILANFYFDDEIKKGLKPLFNYFKEKNITFSLLTGDNVENAHRLFGDFNIPIYAEQTPEQKYKIVDDNKNHKNDTVVMIGDGINDAPALALADVGIVYSTSEQNSAIEAAKVVIMRRDLEAISDLFEVSKRSTNIARQSIWGGVSLSTIGMFFALFGFINPIIGAILQEFLDIATILNSLRAIR